MPKAWIEWAEDQTQKSILRGIKINHPLHYRLSNLWHGIIILQEAKFICDVIENAFRQTSSDFCFRNSLRYVDICRSIPKWKSVKSRHEAAAKIKIDMQSVINSEFFKSLTFYELTELIGRNWKEIPVSMLTVAGFSSLFWQEVACRDVNRFRKDMSQVRRNRNDIAHSRRLFQLYEVKKLYRIANIWLDPLNIVLKQRILTYRDKRPRFLQDVEI
jgi:hypothetical protein